MISMDTRIGEQIRAARMAAGLSTEALAIRIGCAKSDLMAIESGSLRAGSALLYKASTALCVEIEWFFRDCRDDQHPDAVAANRPSQSVHDMLRIARANDAYTELIALAGERFGSTKPSPQAA